MKMMTKAKADAILDNILAIDVESIEPVSRERTYLSNFAPALRVFLKGLGFSNRQIGVQVPDYSMAMMLDIRIPEVNFFEHFGVGSYDEMKALPQEQYDAYYTEYTAFVQKRHEARQHLSSVILAAFPANGDRGDVYTDFFDHTFIIQ